MTLPSTGSISMSQVNVELGLSPTALISLNDTAVRSLAGVPSGTISMQDLRGKSYVVFTPDGGTTAGTPVYLSDDVAYQEAQIIITCNQSATWTYSLVATNGTGTEFVSPASGSASTSITFELDTVDGTIATRQWTVSATFGGVTRYWNVYLRTEYV